MEKMGNSGGAGGRSLHFCHLASGEGRRGVLLRDFFLKKIL